MRITEITDRDPALLEQLLEVWESSVRATHLFLSERDIQDIKKYVPQALKEIPHLVIVENQDRVPVGFMGIVEQHLEMLFISGMERGKGSGKALLRYGIEKYAVNDLAVNEQNPLAKGFYEHMGFKIYNRTDRDEQGNPYPLLYMSRPFRSGRVADQTDAQP
ncbi:GNAT family N-acetyltransferase [Neobittarella massiliensis]|uniref:GNAT family N-acetyltransferase n=1 Tax=Neobittarella massiliensis (ex Bilen et al. 2018) TaxID=2041842 RepID=A0A8J6IEU5_9FIRM|nr:GNAT family N-acetyltransferase [Neobittarella massiliensis]MBC3515870.1 GNAT family N-acetyltransferase [Neobittarella massiliensis]